MGLDIETSGLDFQKDHIFEIGFSIREFYPKTGFGWSPRSLRQNTLYIWEEEFPDPIPEENSNIHKLTSKFLKEVGSSYKYQFSNLQNALTLYNVDIILAHNGLAFDKPFLEAKGLKLDLPWVDSKTHIKYPADCKNNNLLYLAAYHGFLNPFPHQAVSDVETVFKIVQKYDFEKICKRAKEPWILIKADVKFDGKEFARVRGFQWNPTAKHWEKNIPESELKAEEKEAPFRFIRL